MFFQRFFLALALYNTAWAATTFTWNSTTTLSEPGNSFYPNAKIASNGTDSAVAIWSRYTEGKWIVEEAYSSNNGKYWSLPITPISFNPQASLNPLPQIAMNDSDTTIAVFCVFDGINYTIQQAYSSDGGIHWTMGSFPLASSVTFLSEQKIALQGENQAIAVWTGVGGVIQGEYSADGGQTWTTTGDLSLSGSQSPQIAINITDQALVVWERSGIIQAQYSVNDGATWNSSPNLSSTNAQTPQIALNDVGMAICVWTRNNGTNTIIESSYAYDGGATWSTPQILSDMTENSFYPQVSLNDNGEAIVVWQSNDGIHTTIQTAYSSDGGYSFSPYNIISIPSEDAAYPSVSISNDGIGAVTFTNTSENVIQVCSTIDAGATFTTPVYISSSQGQSTNSNVVVNDQDFALLLWPFQIGNAFTVQTLYGSFFRVLMEQKKTKLLLQRDYVNIISCETVPEAFMYRVYADENLTIPLYQGTDPIFYDHGQKKEFTKTYYMTWSDEYDEESSPGVVTGP